ncbi:B-cell differentiation antigen CD72 isoform X2 [Rhinolophus ferrumequinum]|uniref:B-cell differentiation antigen CD72 isoform X2 n=1 Tax=Rhinolophus ferrumequinum TaxID=59479 RepID=UPI00140F93C5|nr:B-cell differentiation antigen CD72 isoform X2 [Rhinolophus ferrumequinum]
MAVRGRTRLPDRSGDRGEIRTAPWGDEFEWELGSHTTGVQSELPTASWSSVTSPAARRLLECGSACSKYLLLGLLLTCLLLGMAAISLGVRYLQVSQQLQHVNRVLEATNSSMRQQLHQRTAQMRQREQDLQATRRELAQSQETLQAERRDCQAVKEKLQACESEREKTKETLRSEEGQRKTLEERLNRMQDRLKPFFTCPSPETCCPVGWILNQRSCFHVSLIKRTWEESRKYCESLSSDLATVSENYYYSDYYSYSNSLTNMLKKNDWFGSYWITYVNKDRQLPENTKVSGLSVQNQRCLSIQKSTWVRLLWECAESLPCICEMAVFRYPDGDHSLH